MSFSAGSCISTTVSLDSRKSPDRWNRSSSRELVLLQADRKTQKNENTMVRPARTSKLIVIRHSRERGVSDSEGFSQPAGVIFFSSRESMFVDSGLISNDFRKNGKCLF